MSQTAAPGASLQLTADSASVRAGGQVTLSLAGAATIQVPVSYSITCGSAACGQITGAVYTAPATVPAGGAVTITASAPTPVPVQSVLSLQVVNPLPIVTSLSPSGIMAGMPQTVTIHGTGFTPGSQVAVAASDAQSGTVNTSAAFVDSSTITMQVSVAAATYGAVSVQVANPSPGEARSSQMQLAILTPAASSSANLSVFPVANYGGSGSAAFITCSADAGTTTLTSCSTNSSDFQAGQGLLVRGGGPPPYTQAIVTPPIVKASGSSASGTHTYCYIVFTVDPLDGISAPSPKGCISNRPEPSLQTTWNTIGTDTSNVGPSPSFLWYVSADGGQFDLLSVEAYTSGTMDVGQRPGSRGGWSTPLPVSSFDISKNEDFYTQVLSVTTQGIVLADPLPSAVQNAPVHHDDTAAVQQTIDAADAAGGGIVLFGTGTYALGRPGFTPVINNSVAYPPYSTDIRLDPWWAQFSRLHIANGSKGHIHFEGSGAGTLLVTPPDHGGNATLFSIGKFQRPDVQTNGRFLIEDTDSGATQVTLTKSLTGDSLAPGDDIWLYSGSFGRTPCTDVDGTSNSCHFSELNTVAAVNGNTITLTYPTSKRYYNDGSSSFGLIKLPVTPHDVAIENMNLQTYDPVTFTGQLYGLFINNVNVEAYVSNSVFGGGFKRDVTIQDSAWGLGSGDASYNGSDEFDQDTNVQFLNNTVYGYAAPGAEGLSLMARIYGTEGSSQFLFKGNTFNNIALFFDQTDNVTVVGNTFENGMVVVGDSYQNQSTPFSYTRPQDPTFDSFGSHKSAVVQLNTITEDPGFLPPFIIRVGHYDSELIDQNAITYPGTGSLAAIMSYSGQVSNNTVTFTRR